MAEFLSSTATITTTTTAAMESLPTPQKKGMQGGYFNKPGEKADAKAATADRKNAVATAAAADTSSSDVEGLSAAAWKEKGNAAFKAGKWEDAISAYTKGIQAGGGAENVENCALFSNRALCAQKLGKFEDALADAQVCVRLKPADFPKGYCRGAMALRSLGRPIEAYAFLDKAPPAMLMSNAELGDLLKELKVAKEKEEEKRLAKMKGAERGKAEGNALFKKAQFEEALKAYTSGLEKCTAEERAGELGIALLNNRAACHHQLSNYSLVIKDADEVLKMQPDNLKARLRRMLALEPMDRLKLALEDARFILARDPRNDLANKVQHRLSKAVRDMEKA